MSKRQLKKAGTMVVAAMEGDNFLKRTWGEDKLQAVKNYQKSNESIEAKSAAEEEEEQDQASLVSAKPKLSKKSTMVATIQVKLRSNSVLSFRDVKSSIFNFILRK